MAFVIDAYARRIDRRPVSGSGLVHCNTYQSNTQSASPSGLEPSVGSVGDSYDNALAETINGLYMAEAIHRRGPWRNMEASSHEKGHTLRLLFLLIWKH